MKKVLLVTVACLFASHAVQAQDDQIGLVGEPWPPGTIASPLPGSVASLGYPTDKFMPVEGDLTQLPRVPYAITGLSSMFAYGDPTKPPFVADPLKPTVEAKPSDVSWANRRFDWRGEVVHYVPNAIHVENSDNRRFDWRGEVVRWVRTVASVGKVVVEDVKERF